MRLGLHLQVMGVWEGVKGYKLPGIFSQFRIELKMEPVSTAAGTRAETFLPSHSATALSWSGKAEFLCLETEKLL